MLLNAKGRRVDPKKLPTGRKAREAVLATLREVSEPRSTRAPMFNIGERFRLKEKK